MARVLLVDDDDAIRSSLSAVLVRHGHEVVTASDGHAGLKAHAEHPVDVILLDINMPGMDGIEVLLQLRGESRPVPVIAITGGGRTPPELLLDNAAMLGATRTLAKPIEMDVLIDTVAEVTGSDSPSEGGA